MNALVAAEYEKLTPFQKLKFNEIYDQWYRSTQKDGLTPADSAYFKMIDWAKRAVEPEVVPEKAE